MSDYLPEEVLIDIFVRLPLKILLQIQCVCKQWRSIISSPSLSATQINRNKTGNSLILRHFNEKERYIKEHYTVLKDDQTVGVLKDLKLEFPFKSRSKHNFRVVGCCNGVLCLSDDLAAYANGIILWNPSIRRYVTLPPPRVTKRTHGSYSLVLGFGFDSKSSDYKVVRIAYIKGRNGNRLIPPEVEVYSLSSRSWRTLVVGAPPYGIYYGHIGSNAFVNGTLHWIGYDPCREGKDNCLIVSFNVCDGMFSEVLLPDSLSQCGWPGWDLSLSHYGDLLSILQYEHDKKEHYFSVWVMKVYGAVGSWSKMYTIDMWGGLDKAIWFMKNGDVLIVTARGKLVAFNINTRQKGSLRIRGAADSFYVEGYMESLILLEGGNVIREGDSITIDGGEEDDEALQWPRSASQNVEEHNDSSFGCDKSFSEMSIDECKWGSTEEQKDEWTT